MCDRKTIFRATRAPSGNLQVLTSKCLRIATNAPWYIGNKQICWFGTTFLYRPPQISERFYSNVADVGNHPLIIQLGSIDPGPLKQGNRDQLVLATPKRRPCRHIESYPPYTFWHFAWQVFSMLFSSVVRQMPKCNTQRRDTARTLTAT
jgi:hypothetical protein